MFEQMNQELEQLKQGIFRYKKIDSMLNNLHQLLKEQEDKELQYRKEFEKEQLDYENINKRSLASIFYTILGSKEEQIEKERQEALSAQLKYDDVKRQIEDTKYQITKCQAEKLEYEQCERKFNSLFQDKYQLLKQSNSEDVEKITIVEQNISLYKSNMKEIEEAISAGNCVISKINNTEESLNSAEGWGLWDMWGGGGLITDMIKHSHIDDARDTASEVQTLLNHFRMELTDVKIISQIDIDIEGFAKFADFFFDGLISDWVVQSRIKDSIESVSKVKDEVNSVIRKLQQMKTVDEENLVHSENELSELIVSA